MKKNFKKMTILFALSTALSPAAAGCSDIGVTSSEIEENGDNAQQVSYTEVFADSSEIAASTQNASTFTGTVPDGFTERDFDTSYENAIKVTLSDGGSVSDDSSVQIDGDVITFTAEGTYILSDELSDGQIVVDLPDENNKIQLVLDGVNITKSSGAGIYVKNADKVFVTTTANSENSIASTGEFVQSDDNNVDGAIYSKDDIVFNGEGSLSVSSETAHGIVSKNDLKVTSGTLTVKSASDALQGKDFVGIAGGKTTLTAGTDGIETVRLAVYDGDIKISAGDDGINVKENDENTAPEIILSGGDIDIESTDDAIQTTGDVTVSGAIINIVSGGGSANAAEHYDDMAFGQMGGWKGLGQGGPQFGGGQDARGEINYDTDDDENVGDKSANKGIKAANVNLTNGQIKIDSQDDAINADGKVIINGGTYAFTAGDDGIHADEAITIEAGTLDIEAWEGLEATVITINDGDITISAMDDGMNATQKVSGVTPTIEINGGNIQVDMAQGDTDALDSNSDLYINGGTLNLNCQSPFDYDGNGAINGGTVYVNGSQVTELYNQMMGGAPGGHAAM